MILKYFKISAFLLLPVAVAAGGWLLADYSYRPGESREALKQLGATERLELFGTTEVEIRSSQTLVLFIHPRCPCTKATIRSLERIYHRMPQRPKLVVYAFYPQDRGESWAESALTDYVTAFADAALIPDRNGDACLRYGVTTSGHLMLFDRHDRLVFSGGITPGRAHEGDCISSKDLLKKCRNESSVAAPSNWPVYGCPIIATEVNAQ